MHEFTVADTTYRLKPLKLKASLKAEAILVHAGLPALIAGYNIQSGISVDTVTMLVSGVERVEELVALFAAQCLHERDGAFVALNPFIETVFERKNAALLAWLVECITWQFADFFDGTGLALLGDKVSALISQMGLTGGSGE